MVGDSRISKRKTRLTDRQHQVVTGICQGMTYAELAQQLYLSERTVRRIVAHLKDLVDAATVPELIARLGAAG